MDPYKGPTRFGVLSTASILKHFIPAVRSLGNEVATVVSVASRDTAKAAACASSYGIPSIDASYDALLARDDIDAIYIPLPPAMHLEWVVKALRAKKHVLVEKPIVLHASEVDSIVEEADRADRIVLEGFMSLYTVQHRQMLSEFTAGRDHAVLGELLSIRTQFAYPVSRSGFRMQAANDGGGSLWDVGCYGVCFALSIMQRLGDLGDPREEFLFTSVARRRSTAARDSKAADVLFNGIMVHRRSGVTIAVEAGFCGPLRATAEIVGTAARFFVEDPFKPSASGARTVITKLGGASEVLLVRDEQSYGGAPPHLYAHEIEAFIALISNKDTAAMKRALELSRCVVGTIEELHRISVDISPAHHGASL